MVMGLLGENLSEIRKSRSGERFSIVTALKLGIKILGVVREVHKCGYIHRDIKPSNFVVGLYPSTRGEIFLIDFGLARKFTTNTGEIKQERDFTGFRGTARYASINSHVSKDLGRRDDLWSVFYLLIEFCKGMLPWGTLKNRDEIGEMKRQYNSPESLAKGLPTEFSSFMNYLKTLDYSDEPNYDYLLGLLRSALNIFGGSEKDPFAWEGQPPAARFLRVVNSQPSVTASSLSSTGSSIGVSVSLISSNNNGHTATFDLVEGQTNLNSLLGTPDSLNRSGCGLAEKKFFTDLRTVPPEPVRSDKRQTKLGESDSYTMSSSDGEESLSTSTTPSSSTTNTILQPNPSSLSGSDTPMSCSTGSEKRRSGSGKQASTFDSVVDSHPDQASSGCCHSCSLL
eukprot:TRINITY_DN1921_c0_g1_i2.p1 TRINITY_DN1921_c0_g1~~TRINITY_DN1921_c0_g1_i2.p1  ORF type:complete len:397 (-),score=54.93 TRINITY_DN1921_c0_g1_i2:87-1277(-)